ncbi:MAG: GNAT family N-acetyltransferase [Planctomycetota bacterium]|jgi:phosphinothricin acetyltransferase
MNGEDERRGWFDGHTSEHPILVGESKGAVVAWASLSKWSDRPGYSGTAEISLYVKREFRGQGIGRKIGEAIMNEGKRVGLHTVVARIAEGNDASIHLAKTLGFRHVGVMKEVGRKFGKLLDVHLMQLIYR